MVAQLWSHSITLLDLRPLHGHLRPPEADISTQEQAATPPSDGPKMHAGRESYQLVFGDGQQDIVKLFTTSLTLLLRTSLVTLYRRLFTATISESTFMMQQVTI